MVLSPADQGPDFAGISCEQVMEVSDDYVKRQLPPELDAQVRRHIELCPNCRGMFKNMPVASRSQLEAKSRDSRFWKPGPSFLAPSVTLVVDL